MHVLMLLLDVGKMFCLYELIGLDSCLLALGRSLGH